MGGTVFPPAIYLEPNYGGGNEDNGDLPQKIPCVHCYSPCPNPTPSRDASGHPQASLLWGHCSSLLGPGAQVLLCPPRIYFPVLCKFWQLHGRVNGDLLQEDLCNTHTQSPCPCGRPLPTCTSTGEAQTQFYLSFCRVPGSRCAQGLFEPFEHLWQEWGLIQNANSPLLPSCCDFSFALGCGVSPHSTPVPTILLGFL